MNARPLLLLLLSLAVLVIGAVGWGVMHRASGPVVTPSSIDAAIAASWTQASADWKERLKQDETQRQCTVTHNNPSPGLAAAIVAREKERIVYPKDGVLIGDWKRGEALAQSGYGGRFTDTDTTKPTGGNCYACHQLAPSEISFGTLGPSLAGYGKSHSYSATTTRAVYDKIYDSHALHACSLMPRFGAAGLLSIDQVRDIVAYVMAPESPVNDGPAVDSQPVNGPM